MQLTPIPQADSKQFAAAEQCGRVGVVAWVAGCVRVLVRCVCRVCGVGVGT